ncbi:MAG: hypothetical protein COA62_12180 [Rhodobiaceae bacterium]|nr:MAG: hypothetical protein COA62_12180 [Rhodobiaceae bacterium]
MAQACLLPDRAVLQIGGSEAQDFLQNLLSNNLDLISPERAIYTLLLTPQGKYLFDFFLMEKDGAYLVDCDRTVASELLKRLTFYKLRADVSLSNLSQDWAVGVTFDSDAAAEAQPAQSGEATPFHDGIRFHDPRLPALGTRFLVPKNKFEAALAEAGSPCEPQDYNRFRLSLAIPGADDLIADKTFPLEANLDLLNAIDYQKGCFVGQEVTSRTHRQGKVRKRILCVSSATALPPSGSAIMAGERQAGALLSSSDDKGLALLRLDRLDQTLNVDGTDIEVRFPDWLTNALPEDDSQ